MKMTVIGCGRWGSFIAWYLHRLGHQVTLYGRETSKDMHRFLTERKNDLLTLPSAIKLTTSLDCALNADVIFISISSQSLQSLMDNIKAHTPKNQTFVLCMKGLEVSTGRRLSQVAQGSLDPSNAVAVWLGPGHVQEFCHGIPNCMVIDSEQPQTKENLIDLLSGNLIRFYYGQDLIGNELGAAAKNVIGIAAGMLDGLHLSTLKGALMSRGTREIARLIAAMGGNELSAYGLCHLGDYEATVFSQYSHNRKFGEAFILGEPYAALAEGYATTKALVALGQAHGVDLPICDAVYQMLYEAAVPGDTLQALFARSLKNEF